MNPLSVFDHFVGLALEGLTQFRPVFYVYTLWKQGVFWRFQGGREMDIGMKWVFFKII